MRTPWRSARERCAVLLQPRPERRAAAAERRAELALERERYPAVCIGELRRASIEAERRRWLGAYGEWHR